MAKIRFVFDMDRVTIDDLVYLEGAIVDATAVELRQFLTKFVADKDGKPVKGKRALAIVGKMTVGEVMSAIGGLGEKAKDALVPPPQGGS